MSKDFSYKGDYSLGDPIEFVLKWITYICFAFLIFIVISEIFAFVWIVILQKRDYDRHLFWIKPKSKRKSKKKKDLERVDPGRANMLFCYHSSAIYYKNVCEVLGLN